MTNKLLLTFTLSLFVSLHSFVLAQQDTLHEKQIKEITVYSFPGNNVSLPYITVDKQKIQKQDYISTADLLRNETGISLSRDGAWATSVNIRGLSEQRLLFLVDNDRVQTATDIAGVLSTVNLTSLDKIEVIKGAASVLYGNGAMGGVVNFISHRPNYTENLTTSGRVSAGYQTVNNLFGTSANVDITNKDWYLSVNGSYKTAGNTMTPTGVLPNSQLNNASWGLTGGMNYKENQELLVSYNHYEAWNTGLPGSSLFSPTATVRYLGFKRDQLSGEYIFRELTDNMDKLSLKAYTQSVNRDVENIDGNKVILPSSMNTTSGVKATADFTFDDKNFLTIGAETWIRKSETIRTKIIKGTTDTTFIFEQPTPKANMFDAGVFGLYKYALIPEKLNLHAGLRLDFIQTTNDTAFAEINKYKIDNDETIQLTPNKTVYFNPSRKTELAYAAHIDLEYVPANSQKLLFSLATSYRAASIEERYKYLSLTGGVVHKGNPDLLPEKGMFSNLSYSFSTQKLLVKADVFANYLFDLITEELVSTGLYVNTNISEAFFAGAEAELNYRVSNNLGVVANVSYVRGRDVLANSFLPQIPPLHGYVSVNYILPNTFETSLSTEWAAKQVEAAASEAQTDGYVVFNWDVRSKPLKVGNSVYILLSGGVNNILNTAYYNHLASVRNGGVKYLEPGRNLFAKASLSW